jgi:TP901 family phage tail tape measure protein
MSGDTKLGIASIPIRAILDQLDKDLDKAKKQIEDKMGKGLTGTWNKLGSAGAKAFMTGLGAITAAIGAVGKMAFDSAMTLDDAFDTIQVATGATGDELQGLEDDFEAVFTSVPTDAAVAAEALSALAQRTGLTGEALQTLTEQMLEMSRITGTDATSNSELFTRVLGDWSIASEDASATMDLMYRATQETGIGFDQLSSKIVQYGTPLRAMGFSFEESVAMLGKWEKEGVNTELVLSSLRRAAVNFAEAQGESNSVVMGGVDSMAEAQQQLAALQQKLALAQMEQSEFNDKTKESTKARKQMQIDDLTNQIDELTAAMALGEKYIVTTEAAQVSLADSLAETIDQIKNAESDTEALGIAQEVFGALAANDMAMAIRENRFDLEDLTAALEGSEGAILANAQATMDWPEKWTLLKNKATTALAPVGGALMEVAGAILDKAMPALDGLVSWFQDKVEPAITPVVEGFGDIGQSLGFLAQGDISDFSEMLASGLWGIGRALGFDMEKVGPVIDKFVELTGTIGTFVTEQVIPFVQEHAKAIGIALIGIGAAIVALNIAGFISSINPLTLIIAGIVAVVALLAAAWTEDWGGIRTWMTDTWSNVLQPIFQAIGDWLSVAIPAAMQWLSDTWNNVLKPVFDEIWNIISTYIIPIIATLVDVYISAWILAFHVISGLITEVVVPALTTAWAWIVELAGDIGEALNPVIEKLGEWFTVVADTLSIVLGPVLQWLKESLLDPLIGAFTNIGDKIQEVIGFFGKLADGIKNVKLPDWLTPGSPTPFELGLAGINAQMEQLAGKKMPQLEASLSGMGAPAFAGSESNLTSSNTSIGQINVYSSDPDRAGQSVITELKKKGAL